MGGLKHLGDLQNGRIPGHLKGLLAANPQAGLREMLADSDWSPISASVNRAPAQSTYIGDRPAYLSACTRLTRFRPSAQPWNIVKDNSTSKPRLIGMDAHPDTFSAALLEGPTPAAAIVQKVFNRVPVGQLCNWAQKHTLCEDQFVLEAGGNSFQIVRTLAGIGRQALVLESAQLGKLKEAHANNDPISAVRIGKAYLAGTAKRVWVPDSKTQERRDLFHTHRKAVKRTSQMRSRINSYLSDNGVRLKRGTRLATDDNAAQQLAKLHSWSPRQWQVIEGMLLELRHAEEQRAHWRSLIAQEVLTDPLLLSLVRLCGVRELVAFALGAIIGQISRFARPASLVKYIGLNPAVDNSGKSDWSGGISGHGRKDLRALLIESAQSILRSPNHPLALWGKRLLARKGSKNLAVAALARKLTVAIWYLLNGRWTPLQEIDASLETKLTKIVSQIGSTTLKRLPKSRQTLKQDARTCLKAARIYVLDPNLKFKPLN